ncbi:MAG: NAD(P)/FAD-dependent oxidoreductase [Alphaproteobacteria bacterium]
MTDKKRIVIVGAGFAGLAAARGLKHLDADVVLIDRRNYHLFQPLLYQVATAALSPAQIAQPIRAILREQKNCTVALAEVTGIDPQNRLVKGRNGQLRYDYLIVATGATHAYFGKEGWSKHAPGLKSIEDATTIRQKILAAFEKAEASLDETERSALLTFVVVGGGPTGVEMAGAIAELARHTLKDDFRRIDPRQARIILAEGSPTILKTFPPNLSARARQDLERLGVEVRTSSAITECDEWGVALGGESTPTRTVIWAAGVKASDAGQWLGASRDRADRVIVGEDLSLPSHPEVFVIGDTALVKNADGMPVPGLAPAAIQQGHYVASVIAAQLTGKASPRPFAYRNYGTMATIGRAKAIADFNRFTVAGFAAWALWGLIHLMPLVGFRNRLVVACDWLWSYATHERGVRLITVSQKGESEF